MIESGLIKSGLIRTGLIKGIRSEISRYFRRNEGTTDYISHAAVTVDRIVMDIYPDAGNGNTGLPTGAPTVTDNVLQTIDFAYSGTISELCRNGSSYFSGIMANVKYYFGGVQIHGYDIKSNSNDIPDTIGSNNATVINGNAEDWAIYTKQDTGEWLGQELSQRSEANQPPDTFNANFSSWNVFTPLPDRWYRVTANIVSQSGLSGWASGNNIPTIQPQWRVNGLGVVGGDYLANASAVQRLFESTMQGPSTFDKISAREVLNVA